MDPKKHTLYECLRIKFTDNIDSIIEVLLDVYRITSWADVVKRNAEYGRIKPNILYACSDAELETCKEVVNFLFTTPTI